MSMAADHPKKYYVTLVHGTFAKDAAWTKEDSVLRRNLEKELNDDVKFFAFEWSGRNSQKERLRAGVALKRQLLKSLEEQPYAAHFIISHSHGGNIAMIATRAKPVASKLIGLVCLATPFLAFRSRRFSLMLSLLVLGIIAFPLLLCSFILITLMMSLAGVANTDVFGGTGSTLLNPSALRWLRGHTLQSVAAIVAIVATAISGHLWLFKKFKRWINRKQCYAAARYPQPQAAPWRLLAVSLLFDEARLLLRSLWRIAELPFWFWHPYVCIGFSAILLFTVEHAYWGEAFKTTLNIGGIIGFVYELWISLIMALWVCFIPVVIGQLIMFATIFVRGHPAGYGWEGLTTSWLGCVTATEKPPLPPARFDLIEPAARQCDPDSGQQKPTWSLRHSRPYQSPAVVREIAQWMKQQFEERSKHDNAKN